MSNKPEDSRQNEWSEMRPHEEFLELCAISATGELTEEERARLDAHLEGCAECRHALKEFDAVASIGAPLIAAELASDASGARTRDSSIEPELVGVARERVASDHLADELARKGRELSSAHENGRRRSQLNWNWVWVPLGACVVLTVALVIYSFEAGKRRGQDVAKVVPASPDTRLEALERKISDAGHDGEVLKAQLTDRDRTIADLRRQIDQQSTTLNDMKSAQASLAQSAQTNDAEKQQIAQERSNLSQKFETAQASLQKSQSELDSVRQQRSQDEQRSASLRGQISDLSAQLREREQALSREEELLGHDRDIRDLMGARDLYIAEVYDVARDGATQKPYGRVFYTKGKSLIFYAYDLDQQGVLRSASTFQAWGRRGPDKEQALSLGVFFEDSAAKKRWVLKFDDPQKLAEIDAIFVTVEPNGGSHKPSGKPLLFAYLKIDSNHP